MNITFILLLLLFALIIGQLFNNIFQKITYCFEFVFFLTIFPYYNHLIFADWDRFVFWIIIGVLMGFLTLFFSIILTKLSFKDSVNHFIGIKPMILFYIQRWWLLIFFLIGALYEEYIWRCGVQSLIHPALLSIPIVALFFTLRHAQSLGRNLLRNAEFLLFSLFLGIAFWFWHSFIFVVLVHAIRNVGVFYYINQNQKERVLSQEKYL